MGNARRLALGLAAVAADQGEDEWAVPLLASAQGLLTSFGAAWWPADRVEVDRVRSNLRYKLGDERFQELWDQGEGMSMEQAIEHAAIRGP